MLLYAYNGGNVFGRSEDDDPSVLAITMLGILICCLNGSPKILLKMIPVSKLQFSFLFQEINTVTQCINVAGVVVKAIIYDGIWVNQAFFACTKPFQENYG